MLKVAQRKKGFEKLYRVRANCGIARLGTADDLAK